MLVGIIYDGAEKEKWPPLKMSRENRLVGFNALQSNRFHPKGDEQKAHTVDLRFYQDKKRQRR